MATAQWAAVSTQSGLMSVPEQKKKSWYPQELGILVARAPTAS